MSPTAAASPPLTAETLTGRPPAVIWRDLVALSRTEQVWELTLSLPWLVASLACYAAGWWMIGLACSFFFFLTGLRQSHNAQHSALGVGRPGHDLLLFALSVLMLSSMHAVRVTHLHHHKHCLDADDHEARHAGWPWWRAIALGPAFPISLHVQAWRLGGTRDRAWIAAELAASVGSVALALGLTAIGAPVPALSWHLGAMATGECFTGFFAVWIVHRGCSADGPVARTQRGWLKNVVSYSMFYHLEHHLWPAVPTCHLGRLAERLDPVDAGAAALQVF